MIPTPDQIERILARFLIEESDYDEEHGLLSVKVPNSMINWTNRENKPYDTTGTSGIGAGFKKADGSKALASARYAIALLITELTEQTFEELANV